MKRLILAAILGTVFASGVALSDKSLNKKHKGMEKDGENINCVYCHKKAGNPKEGTDFNKYKSGKFCKGSGCHE